MNTTEALREKLITHQYQQRNSKLDGAFLTNEQMASKIRLESPKHDNFGEKPLKAA